MYHVINAHIDLILEQITPSHVVDYDNLYCNLSSLESSSYQRQFKAFWQLNPARLSEVFCAHYFATMKAVVIEKCDIRDIARMLYQVETHTGRRSLQFSFASKLLHMADNRTPIYDSMVADFFFFTVPDRDKPIDQRIEELASFHSFLAKEYSRVIENGLLAPSIARFRDMLSPKHFTDEKIIDSLIWGFVSLQRKGAAGRGKVVYC